MGSQTVVFAFRQNAPGLVSWLIRFVTKSEQKISHVEVVFPDGRSFSSREPKGAAWADIDYSQGQWKFCSIEVTDEQLAEALKITAQMEGRGYDFLGIVRFYLGWSRNNDRPFCSEYGGMIAKCFGLALNADPNLISPQRLFDLVAADPRVRVE